MVEQYLEWRLRNIHPLTTLAYGPSLPDHRCPPGEDYPREPLLVAVADAERYSLIWIGWRKWCCGRLPVTLLLAAAFCRHQQLAGLTVSSFPA
jgi:hypothetical protein